MILDALREASRRMVDTPALWTTGLYLGAILVLDILLQTGGDTVLGPRIGFLGLCALPFFLGGSYGVIRGGDTGIRGYAGAGARYYFGILLAGAVILGAALLTALLVLFPAALLGGNPPSIVPFALLGVGIPFAFFTFFADTAAVFEDRKVLDSIRRSVEFVTGNPWRALGFYLVSIATGLFVLLISAVIWSVAIADRIGPLVDANPAAFQDLGVGELVDIVGLSGLWSGLTIGFFATVIWGTFILSFKACFFRRLASSVPAPGREGEFDEKGRWYRY
jgi:hypothetical protein